MASFLDADGIKALLPPGGGVSTTSPASILTPAPTQFQSSTPTPSSFPSQTPVPTLAPTSAAPISSVPSSSSQPLPASQPLPTSLQYPTTLVAFVHEGAWAQGKARLLTIRGDNVALQEASNRDLGQVFAVDSTGRIRSASGNGMYVAPHASCDTVSTSTTSALWTFTRTPSGSYDVQSVCGGSLKRMAQIDPTMDVTGNMQGLLGMTNNSASGWFIVPAARA